MKKIDLVLLATVIFLTVFGFFMVYEASSYVAFRDFGDKYHYVKDHFFWLILGFSGLIFFANFNYHRLFNLSVPLLFVAIILLILVFIPGIGVHILGASRWVNFGITTFQPAEFVKLVLAIYLASWFSKKEKGRLLAFLMLLGLIMFLVILEPDFGTAGVILIECMAIYFLSGGRLIYFAAFIPSLFIIGMFLIKSSPYRAKRLEAYLNVNDSLEKSSYHVKQMLIALGSGGIAGVGFGNSLQKYAYLPEATTDSIFAIISEEIGFIGATIVILLFILIVWRGFSIALKSKDKFGKLLAGGIITFLGVQAIINLAAVTAFIPLTGIPLPFISYGGSALIIDLCSIGILLNISKRSV